jgi:hypothetical protein
MAKSLPSLSTYLNVARNASNLVSSADESSVCGNDLLDQVNTCYNSTEMPTSGMARLKNMVEKRTGSGKTKVFASLDDQNGVNRGKLKKK